MALDFAVLSADGLNADIVSLEIHQHDELMRLAEKLKLPKLLRFGDYFEEIDVPLAELPSLSEELSVVRKAATKPEIAKFADHLTALIGLAVSRKQLLTAVPD